MDHILLIQKDVELKINSEEVKEVQYVTYDEAMKVSEGEGVDI